MSRKTMNDQPPAKRRRLSPTSSESLDDGEAAVPAGRLEQGRRKAEDSDDPEDLRDESSDLGEGEGPDEEAESASEDDDLSAQGEDDEEDEQKAYGGVPLDDTSKHPAPLNATPSRPLPRAPPATAQTSHTKANAFQLEVEDLLEQAEPGYDNFQEAASECLKDIKKTIEGLPGQPPVQLAEAEKRLLKSSKIAIPFPPPRPSSDVKYNFGFSRPESINVVGSYALKSAIRSDGPIVVDLVVHMPASLFEPKDYLNYRYFHKRAHYLAWIAAGLQRSQDLQLELRFCSLNDNKLLPVLHARPRTTAEFVVQLIPALATDIFPLEKTHPTRNCVRTSDGEGSHQPPTPFYNGSLRSNCTVNGFLKLLHGTNARCEGFRNACKLGRTWLQQRGLTSSVATGGFGGFEWATVMAFLMGTGGSSNKPILAPSYSPIQLFGTTLHFLATRDLSKIPLSTGTSPPSTSYGAPVFFDSAHGINVLYKMNTSSYQTLRKEAQRTSRLFGGASLSRFESMFVTKVAQPLLQYDVIFNVPHSATPSHVQPAAMETMQHIVSRGLGDRASQIRIEIAAASPWPLDTAPPCQKQAIEAGIVLDPGHSARSVDRGPSAEDAKATADFRSFWGDKAELRRFKDGSIQESLVWGSSDPIAITKEIVLHVLERHVGEKAKVGLLALGNDFSGVTTSAHLAEAQFESQRTNSAYTLFESTLRGLDGLPLTVRQIQPCGAAYRNSHLPISRAAQGSTQPVDVVIQFEGSSRWPDDLGAIQTTKIAFLLKLSELLAQTETVSSCRLGLESEKADIVNKAFLDVSLGLQAAQGVVFRLRIHHTPEVSLLEQRLAEKNLPPSLRSSIALAFSEHKRTFLRAPLHTQGIAKLSTLYPAYPATARLLKVWLNAQHLGNHFSDELAELLAAKAFLQPEPWSVPSSAQTGFLRTLAFLARWDWQADPVILDFSGSMRSTEIKDIRTRFEAWRKVDPAMNRVALFVGSSYDTDAVSWTEHAPSKAVAARMTVLARVADKLVQDKGLKLKLASLFKPSTKGYDFVIRLQKAKKKATDAGKTRFKNLQISDTDDSSMTGFDPADLYLEELQRVYGDATLFFYNRAEQDVIAGLWSPHTMRRRLKVNLGWSSVPMSGSHTSGGSGEEEGAEVRANKEAMLAEMARLGGDLVRSVEAQR